MEFFEKLSETIANTGKDLAKKTKELTDLASLNLQIRKQEDNIKRFYQEIGRSYFKSHAGNEGYAFEETCNAITEAMQKVNQLKEEIQDIKGAKLCIECGAKIDSDATYCPSCGSKVEDTEV